MRLKLSLVILISLLIVANIKFWNGKVLANDHVDSKLNKEHVQCMAKAIYFESKNEPLVGQLAVGFVVKNRSNDVRFPNDICEVVHEGPKNSNGTMVRNMCQFSWYCDGVKEVIHDKESWRRAMFLSELILSEQMIDITEGALFFHANTVRPGWKFKRVAIIGNHIFYKS